MNRGFFFQNILQKIFQNKFKLIVFFMVLYALESNATASVNPITVGGIAIYPRSWDTEHFGFAVGSMDAVGNTPMEEGIHIDEIFNKTNFRLVYLFASKKLDDKFHNSGEHFFQLVDGKITLSMDQFPTAPFELAEIVDLTGKALTEDILNLAFLSGNLSRFKIDSRFPDEKFRLLYRKWIVKALEEHRVFGIYRNGKTVGITTLEEKGGKASLGLIAVDPEFQRRGFAQQMIQMAINVSKGRGDSELRVVTQINNQAAVKAYEKMGFLPEKLEYIYHLWRE